VRVTSETGGSLRHHEALSTAAVQRHRHPGTARYTFIPPLPPPLSCLSKIPFLLLGFPLLSCSLPAASPCLFTFPLLFPIWLLALSSPPHGRVLSLSVQFSFLLTTSWLSPPRSLPLPLLVCPSFFSMLVLLSFVLSQSASLSAPFGSCSGTHLAGKNLLITIF